ncbi:MAG: hypothetical protein ACREO4_12670 [Lysobacter sp.]
MQQSSVNEMAAKFTAAYQELKEKKEIDRLLSLVKPMILSAREDGIADKELIEILNTLGFKEKFYPAKLKELRKRLLKSAQGDLEEDPVDTHPDELFASAILGGHGAAGQPR